MKKIFFLFLVFCFTNALAQPTYYDFKKYQEKQKQPVIVDKNVSKSNHFIFNQTTININKAIQPQSKLSHTLSNGNKVYVLPKDNMLCIVPDMQHYNMPNPARGLNIYGMPPGRMPQQRLIPEEEK